MHAADEAVAVVMMMIVVVVVVMVMVMVMITETMRCALDELSFIAVVAFGTPCVLLLQLLLLLRDFWCRYDVLVDLSGEASVVVSEHAKVKDIRVW